MAKAKSTKRTKKQKAKAPAKKTKKTPSAKPTPPRPRGRPTNYDPKFCEMLIEHMAAGLSFESFAGVVGVNRDTLYAWISGDPPVHPEFSDAKKHGTEMSRLWWEKCGCSIAVAGGGNAPVWIFNMKNRFHWRDEKQIEHSGNPDKPLEVNITTMPREERLAKIQEIEAKLAATTGRRQVIRTAEVTTNAAKEALASFVAKTSDDTEGDE